MCSGRSDKLNRLLDAEPLLHMVHRGDDCNMLPNQCASLEKAKELCTAGCCNGDPGSGPDHGSVETTTFFNYQVS